LAEPDQSHATDVVLLCHGVSSSHFFLIRNVSTFFSFDWPSSVSPVCLRSVGMPTVVSGSVHSITSTSPRLRLLSPLRVRSAGRGHFKPRRFNVVSAMLVVGFWWRRPRQYSVGRWPVNPKISASRG